MDNQIDHFSNDAMDYGATNLAIVGNNIHDVVQIGDGDHLDAMQGSIPNGGETPESNIYIANNVVEAQPDPALTVSAALQGIDAFDGDWTNVLVENNRVATSSCWALQGGSIHNGLIANNTAIDTGVTAQEPGCVPALSYGWATHEGAQSTNVTVTSNIAPQIAFGLNGAATADHNVSTTITNTAYYYNNAANGAVFEAPVLGQVVASSSGNGNIKDGIGQTNEFVSTGYPYTFALLPNAPAATAGSSGGAVGGIPLPVPPVIATAPAISGLTIVGQTLSASTGAWTNCTSASPCTYSFGWRFAQNPTLPGDISTQSLPLLAQWVGNAIAVDVTATNSAGSATVSAVTLTPVVPDAAPANTVAPSAGTWSNCAAPMVCTFSMTVTNQAGSTTMPVSSP